MVVDGGGLEQALGYLGGATAASFASAAVFGTVTGTASLVTTGALVASGVGLAVLGVVIFAVCVAVGYGLAVSLG